MATPQDIRTSLDLPETVIVSYEATYSVEDVIDELLFAGADPTVLDREGLLDYITDQTRTALEDDWPIEVKVFDTEGEYL